MWFVHHHCIYCDSRSERYFCEVPYAARLQRAFETACAQHGIATHLPVYEPQATRQLALF